MAKKITEQEFLIRFKQTFPEAEIELIVYTAISKPIKVKCKKCGKIITNIKASNLLKNYSCCIERTTKWERLQKIYSKNKAFSLVKKIDKDNVIIHCNKCGNDIKRNIQACLQSPFACQYCDTTKSNNMLSIKEVQERLNKEFNNTIQILTYNGQLEQNIYKCLKCGLIFKAKQTCLMQSRGCPKCDRFKSKGESFIANYLKEHNIIFVEQDKAQELPLQHFDFGLYDTVGNLLGYIEVQGEQHFEARTIFRDSLEIIQERDERKRAYCKKNNIPLYELIYKKGKFLNLDILPF